MTLPEEKRIYERIPPNLNKAAHNLKKFKPIRYYL